MSDKTLKYFDSTVNVLSIVCWQLSSIIPAKQYIYIAIYQSLSVHTYHFYPVNM